MAPFIAAVVGRPPSFVHARKLTHEHGMVQFALGAELHLDHGYCLDDNARAFLTSVLALRLDPTLEDARVVGDASLTFMERSLCEDGWYHNLMDEDGSFTDERGSEECTARTIWACGVAASAAPSVRWRERCTALLQKWLAQPCNYIELRPKAYTILGLAAAVDPALASTACDDLARPPQIAKAAKPVLEELCEQLRRKFEANAESGWEWWEPSLTWGNARLPEALLRGATALTNPALEAAGLRALGFLAGITHSTDVFVPIGNEGWYYRGGPRAMFDQQPIEACGMVDLWLAAWKATGAVEFRRKALEAFGWFFGLNTEGLVLVEPTGGCHDGLEPERVNVNMGAESTLSYLAAHCAVGLALRSNAIQRR